MSAKDRCLLKRKMHAIELFIMKRDRRNNEIFNEFPDTPYAVDLPRTCRQPEPSIEPVQALADISRSRYVAAHNATRAPLTNPPNSAQLGGEGPSYIRVRAIV